MLSLAAAAMARSCTNERRATLRDEADGEEEEDAGVEQHVEVDKVANGAENARAVIEGEMREALAS